MPTLLPTVLAFSILVAAALPAQATAVGNSSDCRVRGAYVIEHNFTRTDLDFTVNFTDFNNGGQIVASVPVGTIAAGGQSDKIDIPAAAQNLAVCDVVNHTRALRPPGGGGGPNGPGDVQEGAEHDQKFEVLYKDPATGKYVQHSIFQFLQLAYGSAEIEFMDFWFDVNGDGRIDALDHMYALYDMGEYTHDGLDSVADLNSRFSPGQVVDIISGKITGIDGLSFSTTAFTFDENTGYQGTAFTGTGYGVTDHVFGRVPEPQTLGLLLAAFGAAAWVMHPRCASSRIRLGLRP